MKASRGGLLLLLCPAAWAMTTFRIPGGTPTIQAALNAASDGDEIIVDPGLYNETLNFGTKSVRVHSSQGAAVTTISGSNGGPVVLFTGGSGALIGFTVQNGNAVSPLDEGGGISVQGGTPDIEDNTIQNNRSSVNGGGIGVSAGTPTIRNNLIRNNTVTQGSGGAGISIRSSGSAVIVNNIIRDNQSSGYAGGIALWSGTDSLVTANTILNNRGGEAGGIFVSGGNSVIAQNVIAGNSGAIGGISGLLGYLVNNTVADNTGTRASALGGFASNGTQIVNNVLTAPPGQTLLQCDANTPQFRSNLLFALGPIATGTFCADPSGGNGNSKADPLFVCAGNYRLQSISPAIDKGEAPPVNLGAADLDGAARVADGGTSSGTLIDRGAYEFLGPSALNLSSTALVFAAERVGVTSLPRMLSLSNTGPNRANFCMEKSGDADFQAATDCTDRLEASQSCSIRMTFQPSRGGPRSGAFTIRSNATGSMTTLALAGVGLNLVPAIDSIAPTDALVNSAAFSLQVTGSNFSPSSTVQWGGVDRPTAFVSPTLLTAAISSADLAAPGRFEVRVFNAAPGGGATPVKMFTISSPVINASGLLNGGSYSARVSAGSYAALFGTNLSSTSVSASTSPLPTTLGGVSVLMNGFAAPLFFVSPSQVNLQIPWELAGTANVSVVLTSAGASSPPLKTILAAASPALLSQNQQGTGQGSILVAGTGQLADAARPANRTEAVEIYAIGLGPVANPPASGAPVSANGLAPAAVAPTVEFGGIPGRVLFAGLAPGLVGLYQVNVQLPLNAPSGAAVPVVLKLADAVSNTVTIAIQ